MANQILGKNVFAEMLISGVYYPIFCGKTAEKITNQDEIEVTNVNSGASREYVPGMSNFTVNVAGVTILNNSEGRISPLYLDQQAQRRLIATYRFRFIDQSGNTAFFTFSAFLTNVTISRDVVQWSQCSISLRVTGDITYGTVVPAPGVPTCEEENPIYATLADGSATYSNALLIPAALQTITVLAVTRSGTTYYQTTGTPGNLEFKYTSGTGTITFLNVGNPAAPDLEPISIEYKIST